MRIEYLKVKIFEYGEKITLDDLLCTHYEDVLIKEESPSRCIILKDRYDYFNKKEV